MTQRRLHPVSRILVLLLSMCLITCPGQAQDMLGETSFSGTPNVSMPSGLSGLRTKSDGPISAFPTIRQSNPSIEDDRPLTRASSQVLVNESTRPLPPNNFQQFVLEATGQALPLFGSSFFTQSLRWNPSATNALPVDTDYRIGPGDELHIRGWGTLDLDVRAIVDRDGFVHIPRIGAVSLAGTRSGQAEDVIRQAVSKYHRDFKLSVTMGQLRGMTIYVVGQARRPGAYSVSSLSTLLSALFLSGGPNQNGSMRHIQVKRGGRIVTDLDLYEFLAKGDKSPDVKLQDGDTIVIPPAMGYVALTGKVPTAAVFEIAGPSDTIGSLLALAGGLPVVADPKRVQLERLDPNRTPSRHVEAFPLDAAGMAKSLQSGDLLTVFSLVPKFDNTVSLRGNVSQAVRSSWRPGMTVRDLIPDKAYLMSRASVKRQNEVLLSDEDRQKASGDPIDSFANDGVRYGSDRPWRNNDRRDSPVQRDDLRNGGDQADVKSNMLSDQREGKAAVELVEPLMQRIGNLVDEVNMDYAVIERVDSSNVSVQLLPFNLGKALEDRNSPENLQLQAGDVVTVFSVSDVQVPQAKRQIFVSIEGEVQRPGIYQMKSGDTLTTLLNKAGGTTSDAYLFGAAFYREEVRKTQAANFERLANRLEAQVQTRISRSAASVSGGEAAEVSKARVQAEASAQKEALERLRKLKPTGRVMLGLSPEKVTSDQLPKLRLESRDKLVIPARPDFVYVLGSVNTESSLIWQEGKTVQHYLDLSGLTSGADKDELFVVRVDGSVISANSVSWPGNLNNATVMPGDVIVLPEKTDHESAWSVFTRNAKDITQIIYQFSLGAAAIKTLRQ